MKKQILIAFVMLMSLPFYGQGLQPVSYYDIDGKKVTYYLQQDIFAFKCKGNTDIDLICNANTVSNQEFKKANGFSRNIIYFKKISTEIERNLEKNKINNTGKIESFHWIVNPNSNTVNDYTKNDWIEPDGILIANFTKGILTDLELTQFCLKTFLKVKQKATPKDAIPFYYFEMSNHITYLNVFECATKIYETEKPFIKSISPSFVRYKTDDCIGGPTEVTNYNKIGPSNGMWYIDNNGFAVANANRPNGTPTIYSGATSKLDADGDVCECWKAGYTGSGIRIAVIDQGGFDYTHPGMQGQFLNGWDFTKGINGEEFSSTRWDQDTIVKTNANGTKTTTYNINTHSMQVASIIASNANNALPITNQTTNALLQANLAGYLNPVGVAYNAKIVPIITDGSQISLLNALNKAYDLKVDLVNMSMGFNNSNQYYSDDVEVIIDKLHATGGSNGNGCMVIATSGNSNLNNTYRYPGAFLNVFGVGASDPNDLRANAYNAQPWDWEAYTQTNSSGTTETIYGGSNYLPTTATRAFYKVVAPGSLMLTDQTVDGLGTRGIGPRQDTRIAFSGTSAAAPYVTGIAAILLSKEPWLSADQLRDKIISNTDKISNYSSNCPLVANYNNEVFYGRINCKKTLDILTVVEESVEKEAILIKYTNSNTVLVTLPTTTEYKNISIQIFGADGRLLTTQSNLEIELNNFESGIYIVRISDDANIIYTSKILKK